jgi:hypothetical protein
MAAYFQLISKTTKEPALFNAIDIELCNHFKQPIDDEKYLSNWYDSIGFRIATGNTLDDIIREFTNLEQEGWVKALLSIAIYLNEHYTTNNWSGH